MLRIQRFLIAFTILASSFYSLNFLQLNFPILADKINGTVLTIFSPLVSWINYPYQIGLDWLKKAQDTTKTKATLLAEIERLRPYEEKVKLLQQNLIQQKKIIYELSELVGFTPPEDCNFITTRVLGFPSDAYFSSLLIEKPVSHALNKDMVVTSPHGLIGRITQVSNGVARVMILTNILSRIPVKVVNSNEQAILAGNGSSNLLTVQLEIEQKKYNKMKVGDKLITSGTGGIFPYGIPVATIWKSTENQILAKPLISPQTLSLVMVLDKVKNEL